MADAIYITGSDEHIAMLSSAAIITYKAIFENAVKNYSKLHAAEEEWQKAQQRKAEAGFRKICEQQEKRFEYMMVSACITPVLLVVILGMLWDK